MYIGFPAYPATIPAASYQLIDTSYDMFLCPLTPCSYALLMNSHFLKVLTDMETWFVEPRAKTNKTLACLFRVRYSSVKINKDFFVDRHQFFHKYIVINIIHWHLRHFILSRF